MTALVADTLVSSVIPSARPGGNPATRLTKDGHRVVQDGQAHARIDSVRPIDAEPCQGASARFARYVLFALEPKHLTKPLKGYTIPAIENLGITKVSLVHYVSL